MASEALKELDEALRLYKLARDEYKRASKLLHDARVRKDIASAAHFDAERRLAGKSGEVK